MNGLFRRVLAKSCSARRMYSATHTALLRPPSPKNQPGDFSPPFTHRQPHPAQIINEFRQRATLRLNSQYPQEDSHLPLSEMNLLLRESVKAGDFESAQQLYELAKGVEGFDLDGSLATYILVQVAEQQKDTKTMLEFIEKNPKAKTPFTMELAVGVILQTFDHESLDRWMIINGGLVPFTSELLDEVLVQVYLPHLRWDAVIQIIKEHPKLVCADTWLSILEFGLTPRPAEEGAWSQLESVLRQMKEAGVPFDMSNSSFGEALEAFFERHYLPNSFLDFMELEF